MTDRFEQYVAEQLAGLEWPRQHARVRAMMERLRVAGTERAAAMPTESLPYRPDVTFPIASDWEGIREGEIVECYQPRAFAEHRHWQANYDDPLNLALCRALNLLRRNVPDDVLALVDRLPVTVLPSGEVSVRLPAALDRPGIRGAAYRALRRRFELAGYQRDSAEQDGLGLLEADEKRIVADEDRDLPLPAEGAPGSLEVADPEEDYTTYTEVDHSGIVTVTAQQIAVGEASSGGVAKPYHVYADKGASHFGDFEHLTSHQVTAGICYAAIWGVSNHVGNVDAWSTAYLYVRERCYSATDERMYLIDENSSDDTGHTYYGSLPRWYCKADRSSTTARFRIYTDAARTSLYDTLTTTTSTTTFRYVYGYADESAGGTGPVTIYGLDLQEAAPAGGRKHYIASGGVGIAL